MALRRNALPLASSRLGDWRRRLFWLKSVSLQTNLFINVAAYVDARSAHEKRQKYRQEYESVYKTKNDDEKDGFEECHNHIRINVRQYGNANDSACSALEEVKRFQQDFVEFEKSKIFPKAFFLLRCLTLFQKLFMLQCLSQRLKEQFQ